MHDNDTTDWFVLARYFTDAVTPAERDQVERWIAADRDHQALVYRIRDALRARGRHAPREWARADAIEAVLARVREERSEQVIAALPRRPLLGDGSAANRLAQQLRHWFEGATELATAMLLDPSEHSLTDKDVRILRDLIDDSERERS